MSMVISQIPESKAQVEDQDEEDENWPSPSRSNLEVSSLAATVGYSDPTVGYGEFWSVKTDLQSSLDSAGSSHRMIR